MRKTAKRLFCIGLAFATLFLSACESPTFEDLIPESYGAWEGHYIYRGNLRSKTTGENPERLVERISVGGKTYDVGKCRHYETIGNTSYLTLDSVKTGGVAEASCLLAYDLQTKEQTVFFSDYVKEDESGQSYLYRANYIDRRYDDYVIMNGYRYGMEDGIAQGEPSAVWFRVDYNGNFLNYEYASLQGWTRIGEDDWKRQMGGSLYYRTWESEPIVVCDGVTSNTQETLRSAHFIHKNDVKGFLIVNQHKVFKQYTKYGLSYLDFFDIKTQKTTRLLEPYALYTWETDPEFEYFVTYEEKSQEIEPPPGIDYIFPITVGFSYKLYRIHYKTEGAYVELIYDFQDATDVSVDAIRNGKAYCTGKTQINSFGCSGEVRNRRMVIDLNSKTRSMLSEAEYAMGVIDTAGDNALRERSGWWNGYYYYIGKKSYGKGEKTPGMFGSTYEEYHNAYFLYRITLLTGKEAVMQLWSSENPMPSGVNYCKEMWNSSTGIVEDFVVRSF